jgi:hypothetical protein
MGFLERFSKSPDVVTTTPEVKPLGVEITEEGFRTAQVAQHITNPTRRFMFAYTHVMETKDWNKFTVRDETEAQFARWAAEEAEKRQLPAFATHLTRLLSRYESS